MAAPSWLMELLRTEDARAAVKDAVTQRLDDPQVIKHIEFVAQTRAEAAVSAHVARKIRHLKVIYSVLGAFGLGLIPVVYFGYGYFAGQAEKVRETLQPIGRIPAIVQRTSATFQRLHKDQSDLASGSKHRWELEDRIEELDTIRDHIGPRLTTALQMYVGGLISRHTFERASQAVRDFNTGLGMDGRKGIKERIKYFEAAINNDYVFAPDVLLRVAPGSPELVPRFARTMLLDPSYAEPRVKLAELLNDEFSDDVQGSVPGAMGVEGITAERVKNFSARTAGLLLDAERIVTSEGNTFYTGDQRAYAHFVLALIQFQRARYYAYRAIGCSALAKRPGGVAGAPCEGDKEYAETIQAALDAAQQNYGTWAGASEGRESAVNPRFTYLKARIALSQGRLAAAKVESEKAVAQAEDRGADYGEALNLAAWVYLEGAEQPERYGLKSDSSDTAHFRGMRYRALRYAYRALAITPEEDPETRARVLDTVGRTLRAVGMRYEARISEYRGVRAIEDAIRSSERRDARLRGREATSPFRPPPALSDLKHQLCERLTNAQDVPTMATAAHDSLRLAMLQQMVLRGRRRCTERFVADADFKQLLIAAGDNFKVALKQARARKGTALAAEFGMALNDAMRVDYLGEPLGPEARSNAEVVLERLGTEGRALADDFVLSSELRTLLKSNLARSGVTLSGGDTDMGSQELVALAREAANINGWRDAPVLHTLVVALVRDAKGDRRKLDEAGALVHELAGMREPREHAASPRVVAFLACVDQKSKRQQPIETCVDERARYRGEASKTGG